MRVFLVNKKFALFYISDQRLVLDVVSENVTPFHKDDAGEHKTCQEIAKSLQNFTNGKGCLNMRLRKEGTKNGEIKLEIYSNPLTDTLANLFGTGATIKVELTDLQFIRYRQIFYLPDIVTSDIHILKQRDRVTIKNREDGAGAFGIWNLALKENYFEFGAKTSNIPITGKITITAAGCSSAYNNQLLKVTSNEKQVETGPTLSRCAPDITIISGDGKTTMCHQSVLTKQSVVLKAMLETNMKELETRVIEMPDCCKETIEALLAFLYHGDISIACENPVVAFELLKLSHMYNVASLERKMQTVLLEHKDSSFPVDLSVKLYLFAQLATQQDVGLRNKAVLSLKCNKLDLITSPAFRQLFEANPASSMELFKFVLEGYGN